MTYVQEWHCASGFKATERAAAETHQTENPAHELTAYYFVPGAEGDPNAG